MGMTRFAILATLACLLLPSTISTTSPEEDRLIAWAVSQGAQLRATIGPNVDGVRGIITTEDIPQGEIILDIPDHLIFSVRNAPAAETAPHLLKELYTNTSRLAPYLAVLPKRDEVLTGYNWPEEYIRYLASDSLEQLVRRSFKRHALDIWSGRLDDAQDMTLREAVGTANVSLEEFQHTVSVITSRTFQTRTAALSMVPIADMANHHPDGPNEIGNSPRGPNNFALVAGRDLKKGEEVTITYGDMRNDDLLLYYGFVDEVTQPPKLCACDHREYKLADSDSETLPKEDLMGPYDEVAAEIPRLRDILSDYERRLETLGPIPATRPDLASLLDRFHALRKAALRHEIERLKTVASVLEAEL